MRIRSIFIIAAAAACLLGCSSDDSDGATMSGRPSSGRALRVDLNLYTPGTIPQGIGEPVRMATELAQEWRAQRGGRDIVFQQLINTGSSEGEWLKTQLIGGMAPEIVNMNAEVAWPDVDKGWFVPLDEYMERPNPYIPGNERWIDSFSNQALVGAKRAPDGKLYCVPIDIVETGVFYNRDILRTYGYEEPPDNWDEMLELNARIKEDGTIPFTAGGNLASDWGQDIIFELLYRDILPQMDLVASRADAQGYLGHYLEAAEAGFLFTKGFFTRRDPRWREMNRLLREWRDGWAQELKNTDPDRLFLTGRLAMYWNGSWFVRRMATDPYIDFEWGVGYIPTITQETSLYGAGTPATVIGGAAVQLHVTNSALLNDNVEDCINWLMFLTAPQNIERLASEALVYIPNVVGAKMDERLAPFQDIFERQYCAIKWLESMDGEYKKFWRRMLDYYLNDGCTLDEFLVMLEDNFAAWVADHQDDMGWDFEAMEKTWAQREEALLHELEPIP